MLEGVGRVGAARIKESPSVIEDCVDGEGVEGVDVGVKVVDVEEVDAEDVGMAENDDVGESSGWEPLVRLLRRREAGSGGKETAGRSRTRRIQSRETPVCFRFGRRAFNTAAVCITRLLVLLTPVIVLRLGTK
jgi:hypothetical protein